jgi:(2Fe-2S) ferredoxin
VGERHRVRVSECLKVCERSNVVVVHPAPAARRAGARIVHLGDVLDDDLVEAIAAWLDAGGPGVAAPPALLRARVFDPADYA